MKNFFLTENTDMNQNYKPSSVIFYFQKLHISARGLLNEIRKLPRFQSRRFQKTSGIVFTQVYLKMNLSLILGFIRFSTSSNKFL